MARTGLTPVILAAQNASNLLPANFTTLASGGTAPGSTGAGNGVQFTNFPGQTLLLISVGATACTATIAVGATLYGQPAAGFVVPLVLSSLNVLGPFYSAAEINLIGTSGLIGVDFSSVTAILCAAVQLAGVY
jgi:hypothetical protein